MYLNIDKLLKEKQKSRYWLAKTTGISDGNISRMVKNQTTQAKFDILQKICYALECTPNDLLILGDIPQED